MPIEPQTIEGLKALYDAWMDAEGSAARVTAVIPLERAAIDALPALIEALAGEADQLRAQLREESAIVARIWTQLGGHSYEELAGRSIYDLIAELQAAASLALPAPAQAEPVAWQATHRHLKRGSTYRVIGEATAQAADYITDHMRCVVYAAQDGTIWVRSKSEFEDGRFERVAAPPPPAGEG